MSSLFPGTLGESHSELAVSKDCTAADDLPLKILTASEVTHTLPLSGFNLGCNMKRPTLRSEVSSSGKTLDVVLVFLSLF